MTDALKIPADDQPVRKAAQHLRWFIRAFEQQIEQISTVTGIQYAVDRQLLAQTFIEWKKAFDAQKPTRDSDRLAYVGFAAGLMLRALLSCKPVKVLAKAKDADQAIPAHFWPEGYLYVVFCLNVRGLVIEQDFNGEQHLRDDLNDVRTWWSFKENSAEDPSLAIAFLDLFAGEKPNWSFPGMFRTGQAQEIAGRRVNEIIGTIQ